MGEVVGLPTAKEPRIWVCNCGCSTFDLLETGAARCAACGADQSVDGSGWSKWTAESRHNEDEAFRDVRGNGSIEFARRRIANMAQDQDAALLVVVKTNGTIQAWSEAETKEQLAWARRKLSQAADLFKHKEP